MAENIPTSFVPKKPLRQVKRKSHAGTSVFSIAGILILVASIVLAGLVFGYNIFLKEELTKKTNQVAALQASINEKSVEDLSRLSDRIKIGQGLVENRVATSQVLDFLQTNTLQNVQFKELQLTEDQNEFVFEAGGVAKSFNAMAYQSEVFAKSSLIKDQIFSDIKVDENGNVTFKFSGRILPADILASKSNLDIAPSTDTTGNTNTDATSTTSEATTTNTQTP